MKKEGSRYTFSPSDLINFMRSEFITWMDRFYRESPGAVEPDPDTEEQEIIQRKGIEHERAFLQSLVAGGRRVCDLTEFRDQQEPTLAAMRRGEDVIYQGYLAREDFAGYPDFLVRVGSPSELGAWSYEPWDTKLARHPKPYFLVQLCCYAEMLERAQGVRPQWLRIVPGGPGAEPAAFRTDDFFYYYGALKSAFLDQQRAFDRDQRPEIPPMADLGRWSGYAERELEARDDLALIADIRVSQIRKLRAAGVMTVAQVASAEGLHVPRLHDDTLCKLQRQARLQIASRGLKAPRYELLTPTQEDGPRGLFLLPPASESDVFFDMEGFPLIDDGREYLFGACYYEAGELRFRDWWAHSPAEEKRAFAAFVRWAHARWKDASGAAHLSLQPLRSDGAAAANGKVRSVRTGGGRASARAGVRGPVPDCAAGGGGRGAFVFVEVCGASVPGTSCGRRGFGRSVDGVLSALARCRRREHA